MRLKGETVRAGKERCKELAKEDWRVNVQYLHNSKIKQIDEFNSSALIENEQRRF